MAKKSATPEIQKRITSAIAMIGRGVNQSKPDMEHEGRRQLAVARIENEILLGLEFLNKDDLRVLASILFGTPQEDEDGREEDDDWDEDYSADAQETNAEVLRRTQPHPSTVTIPDDARELAPPLNPTRAERIAAMNRGREAEEARYPRPELLEDPDDIE